ncbi:hypothetical protein ACMZ5D_17775, partial [Acinetobacter baumannii]
MNITVDNMTVDIKPIFLFMTVLTPLGFNQSIVFFYGEFDQFVLLHCRNSVSYTHLRAHETN